MSTFDNYPKYQLTKHGKVINNILKTAEAFFGMNYEFTDATINDGFPKLNGTIGGGKKLIDAENTTAIFESQIALAEDAGKLVLTTDNKEEIGLALSNYATEDHIKALFAGAASETPVVLATPETTGELINGQTLSIIVQDPTTTRYKHEATTIRVNLDNSSLGGTVQLATGTTNLFGTSVMLDAPEALGEPELSIASYPYFRSVKSVQEGNRVTTQDSLPAELLHLHTGTPMATISTEEIDGVPTGSLILSLNAPLGLPEIYNKIKDIYGIEVNPKVKVECKKYYYPGELAPEGEPEADGRYLVALDAPEFALTEQITYELWSGATISASIVLEDSVDNLLISSNIITFNNFITCPAFGTLTRSTEGSQPLIYNITSDATLPQNSFIEYVIYAEDDTVKATDKIYLEPQTDFQQAWEVAAGDYLRITYGGDYYLDNTVTYFIRESAS